MADVAPRNTFVAVGFDRVVDLLLVEAIPVCFVHPLSGRHFLRLVVVRRARIWRDDGNVEVRWTGFEQPRTRIRNCYRGLARMPNRHQSFYFEPCRMRESDTARVVLAGGFFIDVPEYPGRPGLEAYQYLPEPGAVHRLGFLLCKELRFDEAAQAELDAEPALQCRNRLHQLDHSFGDVELIVVEHKAGVPVCAVHLLDFLHDTRGCAGADVAQHRAKPARAKPALERTPKLRDKRCRRDAVYRVAVARQVYKMPCRKGRGIQSGVVEEEVFAWRLASVRINQPWRAVLRGKEYSLLPVAGDDGVKVWQQAVKRAMRPADSALLLFVVERRHGKRGVRAAEDCTRIAARLSDSVRNFDCRRQLRSRRGDAEYARRS